MSTHCMERRQHTRHTVKKHKSFILIPEDTKLGEIIDISLGGMAFHYVANEQWPTLPLQFGTIFGEDDLWLDSIPLTMINDCRITHPFSLGYPEVRRRGIAFGDLTQIQKEFVREFIYISTTSQA